MRVWDVLFLEGPKILFRVALALFKVRLSCPVEVHGTLKPVQP